MVLGMTLDVQNLPNDPAQLKQIIAELNRHYQEKIGYLEEHIRLLNNEIFGRKSEKRPVLEDDPQRELFEHESAEPDQQADKADTVDVPGHKRRKAGRKPLPADLPRVDVIHDLDESEKQCECGCRLSRIGQEVCEKLDIIPAKIRVLRHIRYKYACKGCEGVESSAPTVTIAPVPRQLLPKTMATAGP